MKKKLKMQLSKEKNNFGNNISIWFSTFHFNLQL